MARKELSPQQQVAAIVKVAKFSFVTAPGSVLFKLFGAVIDSLLPIATAYFAALTTTALVGAISGSETQRDQAILYVIITALLGLFSTAWNSVDEYIQAGMRYRVESKVSDRMYEHFLALEFWRYDDKATVDRFDKAQKFAQFFAWVFDRLAGVLARLITMVASIVALTLVNGWLALAVLVAIVPGVYFQFRLSRAEIRHWNANVETRRAKNMIEWDLLQPRQATELRLYGLVKHLLSLRAKLRDKDERVRIDFERQFIGKRLFSNTLQTAAEVGALVWVALEIVAGRQAIGQFIYVQQVVARAISGATGFIHEVSRIDEDVANLFEYEQFMALEQPEKRVRTLPKPPETINFDHVSFCYPNNKNQLVLDDISLTIKKNQNIAIVGENGAGKSTFIKLLAGLYAPTKGQISLDNTDLQTVKISHWHKKLAILTQAFAHFSFANARDNVRFGDINKRDNEQLQKALEQSESAEFIEKLPKGLDTVLNNWIQNDGESGVELSGGQWQRLALARNFYRDAPIIILDEPTSAIDALAESRIFKRLFASKDKTIITISHRLTTIKKADVVYMMQDGRIVEQGTCRELIDKKGAFYRMFESQL